MAIEVGDVLKNTRYNSEFTVEYIGRTHGLAAKANGDEMAFHVNLLTQSKEWALIKSMPKVATSWLLVIGSNGRLEGGSDSAYQAWSYLNAEPDYYAAVIRVNPDRTWDYVNSGDEVLL